VLAVGAGYLGTRLAERVDLQSLTKSLGESI